MKKILIIVMFLAIAVPLHAEMLKEQGVGVMTYKGWKAPKKAEKREAIQKAKINALTRYAAKFDQAKAMNYEKIRAKVESDVDTYVVDYSVIDEDLDKGSKIFKIVILASINASLIEIELQKLAPINKVSNVESEMMTFVFVAREATSVKKFDKRVTKRVVTESFDEETESAVAEEGDLQYSSNNKKDHVSTTGGSSIQKSDKVQYDVSNANEINTAMSNTFSTAGFEVIDAEYLTDETEGLVDVKMFIEDFKYGDDISGQTRRDAVKGCRMVDVMYFAIGTLDVGIKDKDPVSGLTRVFVSVTGKVLGLKKRFPKTVASVGPVQFSGLGPDQIVAKRNALILAAEKAAQELTSQMRAKGIR